MTAPNARSASHGPLDFTIKGAVAHLTFPDHGPNALTDTLLTDLRLRLEIAREQPQVKVLVLRHAGEWFSSGMDLSNTDAAAEAHRFFDILQFLTGVDVITIAVIEGRAAGGGVGLAAACDVVIASGRASFSLPEALWGLLPATIYPVLVRRMGPATTRELTLTTRELDGNAALAAGLVDIVADPVERALARTVARCSCITRDATRRVKDYAAMFDHCPLGQARDPAISALTHAMAAPGVRDGIDRWTRTGRLPWE